MTQGVKTGSVPFVPGGFREHERRSGEDQCECGSREDGRSAGASAHEDPPANFRVRFAATAQKRVKHAFSQDRFGEKGTDLFSAGRHVAVTMTF